MVLTTVSIPVGEKTYEIKVPNVVGVVTPRKVEGVVDTRAEIRRAIQNPIGTRRLRDIARRKKNAAIVVNDITRPYPGGDMVLEIAEELHAAGFTDDQIFLVVAYGNHRVNTEAELRAHYGDEPIDRFQIVHHRAVEPDKNVILGVTDGGVTVEVCKAFAEADVKILTGCIAPHQLAGFSGGRKSVLPGVAGIKSIIAHHSMPIRPMTTSLGWLEGNRFHEESTAAARIAGVDFIVNSVDNEKRELVLCVAGDLNDAYLAGIDKCHEIWSAQISCQPDVVLISPGGFPRDFDLHQSQKAIGFAEMICKPNGMIILCAETRDGAGKPGKLLRETSDPQEIIDRFISEGYAPDAVSKAFMLARAMKDFRIAMAGSKIPLDELKEMFIDGYETIEDAVEAALKQYGENAKFLVVPYASDMIPVLG